MDTYFYGQDVEQLVYYQLPKILYRHPRYIEMSNDSKVLYAFMLDRMKLSVENHEKWTDANGRIYIYYTTKEIEEELHIQHQKIAQMMKELEAANLIERRRQGQGKPTRIYVQKIPPNFQKAENQRSKIQSAENQHSRALKISAQDSQKSAPNNIYSNDTDTSISIYQSAKPQPAEKAAAEPPSEGWKKRLKEQLPNTNEATLEAMAAACAGAVTRAGGKIIPTADIQRAYMCLTDNDIQETINAIPWNIDARRKKKYLLAALYNTGAGKAMVGGENNGEKSEYSFDNMVRRFHDNLNKSAASDSSMDKYIRDFQEEVKAREKRKISPSSEKMVQEFHEEMMAREENEI